MAEHFETSGFKGNKIELNLGRLTKESLPVIKKGLRQYGKHLVGHIQRSKLTGQVLKVRTGVLRRLRWIERLGGLGGGVHSDAKYGKVHEYGPKTILPRNAKFLTIPFPGIKGRARDYPYTFISKRGIIWEKTPVKGEPKRPLFSLKKSVTIPGRPFARPAYNETGKDRKRFILTPLAKLATGKQP